MLFLSKLRHDFYSKIILHKNRILPYYAKKKKNSLPRKFRCDFLMILVDVLQFKDPDPVFFRIRMSLG